MKNFKKISLIFMIGLILISSSPAYAWVTFDPTKGVGKIFVTISQGAKQVQEKITDLQNQIKGQKWVQDGVNAVKYIKATYAENKDMYQKYKRLYNKAKNSDAVVIAQKQAEISKLNRKIEEVSAQKQSLSSTSSQSIAVQTTYYDEQIKILTDNNAYYQEKGDEQSLANIEENNAKIEALELQKAEAVEMLSGSSDKDMAALDREIENLVKERDSVQESLDRLLKALVTDFLSDVKNLTLSQDLNFVRANQIMTSEEIAKIRKGREDERDKVVKEVYTNSLGLKMLMSPKVAQRNATVNNADGLKESAASILMLTESKIDDIEDLLVYIEMLLLDLKLQTAVELAEAKDYQMSMSDKNMEEFDLEDYVFDYQVYKDNKLAKQKLSLRDFKNNIEDVINIGDNLKEEFTEGGFEDEWTDFGEDIMSSENAGKHRLNNKAENLGNQMERFGNTTNRQIEDLLNDSSGLLTDW